MIRQVNRPPLLGKKVIAVAPTVEPLTLAEAKLHIKQDETIDDALVTADITIARQLLEEWTGRAYNTQTWNYYLDGFPPSGEKLVLPWAPVSAVSSVTYVDENGATQTWDPSLWLADLRATPQYVIPGYLQFWPTTRDVPNAVTVNFIAGYGPNAVDVPEPLRQAVRLLVAHLYQTREPIVVGSTPFPMPLAIEAMVNNYVVSWV